jgi:cell division protein FtsI/penicillin-binding protein 2
VVTQSYDSVRIPAARGKIFDRNGIVLAENAPTYNVNLNLEAIRRGFREVYRRIRPRTLVTNSPGFWKRWLGAKEVEWKDVRLTRAEIDALEQQARFNVVSNAVHQVSLRLGIPLPIDAKHFRDHYNKRRAMPYPVARRVGPREIARFYEQGLSTMGLDLETLSTRVYPHQTTAAHVIGQVGRHTDSMDGEEAYFTYRLPDYRGRLGIEYAMDAELRGRAGAKSVLSTA